MDNQRFDELTRAWADGPHGLVLSGMQTRRRVIRGLLAVAGGGAVAQLAKSGVAAGKCCAQKRKNAKENCQQKAGGDRACRPIYFACEETPYGQCSSSWSCAGSDDPGCL
ncbi:MAG: hypothetical protein K0Q89_2460 [Thermomicrobiales bacterium]|jgi:hypothetical protein|nr:hypothetical protein [Thermomicrobiales bacterium]